MKFRVSLHDSGTPVVDPLAHAHSGSTGGVPESCRVTGIMREGPIPKAQSLAPHASLNSITPAAWCGDGPYATVIRSDSVRPMVSPAAICVPSVSM